MSNESHDNAGWNVSFTRMYDMSTDSETFHTKADLQSASAEFLPNQYAIGADLFFPLYEGKMIWQDDHRFGTYEAQTEAQARAGKLPELSHSDKSDPLNLPVPRYWISEAEFKSCPEKISRAPYFFGYREVTNAILLRTIVFAVIPPVPVGHKVPILHIEAEPKLAASFYSGLNSFVFDFVARQKIGGVSMSYFVMRQLPVVPKSRYLEKADWCKGTLDEAFLPAVVELTFTSWDLSAFAGECDYDGPPIRWDEDRRFQIRCELDAAYFHLYLGSKSEWGSSTAKDNREGVNDTLLGMFPTPRDAASYIMDTFPIVSRKDEAKYGEYRTKRVILEIYDQMTEIIEANEAIRAANPGKSDEELRPLLRSYQSPLNPPPGPPTDANGNFIPYADWTDEIRQAYREVIHIDSVSPSQSDKDRSRERQRLEQGQGILHLRLILKERNVPVQFEVLASDLCFALNSGLRRRFLLDEPVPENERANASATAMLPSLVAQLEALHANGVVTMETQRGRRIVGLADISGLDSELSKAMAAHVKEAIEATTKLMGKRDDDMFSANAFDELQPFIKEDELENLTAL